MPVIPVNAPLGYIGVFLFLLGVFLILTGLGIIKIEKITVSRGLKTLGIGAVLVILGIGLLLPDVVKTLDSFPRLSSSNGSSIPTNASVVLTASDYGQLLYEENFDKDTGNWSLGPGSSIRDGKLIIGPGTASSPALSTQYSDFIFETEFQFLDPKVSDYAGFSVYLRFSDPPCPGNTGNCSDQVGVSSTGDVSAWRPNGTENWDRILAPTHVSQLNLNGPNKLTVAVNGSQFRIFINNALVRSFTDSTYKSGIFVLDTDGTATAFDYIRIYALP
jgi:hypothetical protein